MENHLLKALDEFKLGLSGDRLHAFKQTTARKLKECVLTIQSDQDKRKAMMNLTRLNNFIAIFDQFDQAVHSLANQDLTDLSPCIWGPTKSIIETVKENRKAFDCILEAYDRLGASLPSLVAESQAILRNQPEWRICLALIYEDLLAFNSEILKLLKSPDWAKSFPVYWEDYNEKFEDLLKSFDNHKRFLKVACNIQRGDIGSDLTQVLGNFPSRNQNAFEQGPAFYEDLQRRSDRLQRTIEDFTVRHQGNHEEIRNLILNHYSYLHYYIQSESQLKEKNRKKEQRDYVLQWLKSPGEGRPEVQYHESFQRIRSDHPSTGEWFLKNERIKDWVDEEVPAFLGHWVHGKKGAGKTMIASKMIDHLKEIEGWTTSYFYCREDSNRLNEPRVIAILKSLLTQMLRCNQELLPIMHNKAKRGLDELKEEETAITILNHFADIKMKHFIVIDGLDELETRDARRIARILGDMAERGDKQEDQPAKVRIMLLSTDSHSMEEYVESNEKFAHFQLKNDDTVEDIQLFVSEKLKHLNLDPDSTLDCELKADVKRVVCGNSKGVFLYASLVLENLGLMATRDALRDALRNDTFPETYGDVYKSILEGLHKKCRGSWEDSKRVLAWLAYANRPLKLYELKAALATPISYEGQVRHQDRDRELIQDIRNMCGPLVHIFGDATVEFSHSLAREFVMTSENLNPHEVHCDLAFHCLHYLSDVSFKKHLPDGSRESYAKQGHYAFQDYAISQWAAHLEKIVNSPPDIFNGQMVYGSYAARATKALHNFCEQHKPNAIPFKGDKVHLRTEVESIAKRQCQPFMGFEFYQDLLQTWIHLMGHRKLAPKEKSQVSIEELKDVLGSNRKALCKIASEAKEDPQLSTTLRKYYGSNFYKCDRITCEYFYEGLPDEEALKIHSNRHERPFQCPVTNCSFAQFGFSSNKDRDRHVRNYHPELFDQGSSFVPLNQRVVENAKHGCEDCGRNFTRKVNLDAHMNSAHLGLRPFSCTTCGKSFARNSDRKRHEKLHINRRR